MKKLLLLAAVATCAFSLSSCEQMLNSLSDSLVFTHTGTTVIDGQTALLGLMNQNSVDWYLNSDAEKYVSLVHNEDGKNCIASFNLKNANQNSQTKVEITVRDRVNVDKDPYVGEITIAPWKLTILKKNGESWEEIGSSYSYAKNGAGHYAIQSQKFVGLKDKEWENIGTIIYKVDLLEISKTNHYVLWNCTGDILIENQVGDQTWVEFDINAAPSKTTTITLSVGKDRDEKGEYLSVDKYVPAVSHSVTFTK